MLLNGALGDPQAAKSYAALNNLSNAVLQIADLFTGTPDAPWAPFFADLVFQAVAARIASPGATLDLGNTSVIADLITSTTEATGIPLHEDPATQQAILDGAATIIAAGSQAIDDIENTADLAFVGEVTKVKKVMQGEAAPALRDVPLAADPVAAINALVSDYTGANLAAKIQSAEISADLIAPSLEVFHTAVVEGANPGEKYLDFTVRLTGAHSGDVTVEYTTLDGTASVAGNDYVVALGSLTWHPGDAADQHVLVSITGDQDFEFDEYLQLALTRAAHAVIVKQVGYGYLFNDDDLTQILPSDGANSLRLVLENDRLALIQNEVPSGRGFLTNPLVAEIAGQDNVDDTLILDFSANTFRSDTITFHGGSGSDGVQIQGGNFASITQTLRNATDGVTILRPFDSDQTVTLNWFGLEPFLQDVDAVGDIIFELPAGITTAILEDADPSDLVHPGKMQLRSPTGAFETTIFTNPTGSITVRGSGSGSDGAVSVFIASTDPAFTGIVLTLGTLSSPREAGTTVTVHGLATLFGSVTLTRSWNVYKNGYAIFTGGDTSSFSFTPTDIGSYRIVFTADNGAGSVFQQETTVLVVDTTPPTIIDVPANKTVEATGASGAVVTYVMPTASDIVSGSVSVRTDHASGSLFPFGVTTVHFTATDSAGNTGYASFTVSVVNEVNDAPLATDDAATTDEDAPLTLTQAYLKANDSDADNTNSQLAVTADSGATNGTVTLNGDGTVTFSPAANFNGIAGFDYTLSDGSLSATGHVTVTVNAVNDAPMAANGTLNAREDTTATGTLAAVDVDNTSLTYRIVNQANAHGIVTITNPATGAYSYAPAPNFNGVASFTFMANDGSVNSNVATASITVAAVNDAPTVTVVLSADMPEKHDILTATATPVDADGNSVILTYLWKVNGVVVRTKVTSAASDSVDLKDFKVKKNDVIVLELTPSDGFLNGFTTTITATVVN